MIQTVFWDNDGVLVDTEGLYYEASAEVLAGVGIPLCREQFADISLRQGGSVFSLAEPALPPSEIERLRRERDMAYSRLLLLGAPIIPGVEEVLRALHGRVRMAIVTSSRREHFDIIHRDSGLLRYFDFVLTREDYVCAKPDPEPYLAALSKSDSIAENSIVIEDSPRGLASARAAGMRCLVVPGPFFAADQFTGAERMLSRIEECAEIILGSTASVA